MIINLIILSRALYFPDNRKMADRIKIIVHKTVTLIVGSNIYANNPTVTIGTAACIINIDRMVRIANMATAHFPILL